jgi:hypothetical protein
MQPQRSYKVLPCTYQARKGHGKFGMGGNYLSCLEEKKPGGLRKEWLNECIERFSKNPDVKCIAYNHNVKSAYLYEKFVNTSIINKNNYMDKDDKKKNNKATERYSWHTFIIFDV